MARAALYVSLAYLVACLVASGTAWALSGIHPVVAAAIADLLATAVVFGASRAFDNSSFYDPYWSVAPLPIAAYWALGPWAEGANVARRVVLLVLVAVWGIRLTGNWLRQWRGLGHEDWRYLELRRQHGERYWLVSFLGIHLFPTLVVFLGCLPIYWAAVSHTAFGVLDVLACSITASAIVVEALADSQLWRFMSRRTDPNAILDTGLWRHSRHPNYFGEILFWWGLSVFGLRVGMWWAPLGALVISVMFRVVSIPLIERRMRRKPSFAAHVERTRPILPLPRRS